MQYRIKAYLEQYKSTLYWYRSKFGCGWEPNKESAFLFEENEIESVFNHIKENKVLQPAFENVTLTYEEAT